MIRSSDGCWVPPNAVLTRSDSTYYGRGIPAPRCGPQWVVSRPDPRLDRSRLGPEPWCIINTPSVIYTPWDVPERQYKMFSVTSHPPQYNMDTQYNHSAHPDVTEGLYVSTSHDGVHWLDSPNNPVMPSNDVVNVGFDSRSRLYRAGVKGYMAVSDGNPYSATRRVQGATASASWQKIPPPATDTFILPDAVDEIGNDEAIEQNTQFYGLTAPLRYDSDIFVSFIWKAIFNNGSDPNLPPSGRCPIPNGRCDPWAHINNGTVRPQLVTSKDGLHFSRIPPPAPGQPRPDLLSLGPAGAWDSELIFTSSQPNVDPDDGIVRLYYSGCSTPHNCVWYKNCWMNCSVGLATLRRHGFASLHPVATRGSFRSEPLPAAANAQVRVNFRAAQGGKLTIGMLQANGTSRRLAQLSAPGGTDVLAARLGNAAPEAHVTLLIELEGDVDLFSYALLRPQVRQVHPTQTTQTLRCKNSSDCTVPLQRALSDPTVRTIVLSSRPNAVWPTRPLLLNRSNVELRFEPGVVLQAIRGLFHGKGDSLLRISQADNVSISGATGAAMRMWRVDYANASLCKCNTCSSVPCFEQL